MTMRIIFLDVDGVLNTERYQTWLQGKGVPFRDDYGKPLFDPAALANLKRILNALPEVRIVLESTWTFGGHPDSLHFIWSQRGLPGVLFDFILRYDYKAKRDIEDHAALFCQLVISHPEECRMTGKYAIYQDIEYPIIYAK